MIIDQLLNALSALLTFHHFIYLALGVGLGLIVGILPGLGGMAGLSLLLPFVWGMDPGAALAMMLGLQAVTATSDTFPAVLMGIPGTAGSQATTIDGFPMAKRGEGARALVAAFTASMFGGLFGAVLLSLAVFAAEPIILAIGFGERLMLTLLALTMVGMMTGQSFVKGMASCALGLMLGTIGAAPSSGVVRLGLGLEYLVDPLKIVIVGLALFALPEIGDLLRSRGKISEAKIGPSQIKRGVLDVVQNWFLALRCSAIGSLLGALPGLGGSVIDWIAYGHAVQTTKNKKSYGTGDVRGVIAPEAANNAKEGGALIPTILFGIPGSGSMAILLGGFLLIGIDPGIDLVTNHLDLVYLMIWSIALANVLGAIICIVAARPVSWLTRIRYMILAPFMIAVIYFAAFQATRAWGDIVLLTLLGIVGIFMKRFGWSRPAVLIGFVLSPQVESAVYRTVSVYGLEVFMRPLVMVFAALLVLSLAAAFAYRASHSAARGPEFSASRKGPQLVFLACLTALPIALITDTWDKNMLTRIFPVIISVVGLFFLGVCAIQMLLRRGNSVIFFDAEAREPDAEEPNFSLTRFIAWLGGLVGLSALLGFVLGVAIFLFLFLRKQAGLNIVLSLIGALSFVMFLSILADLLVLHYPQGILQSWIKLPWPLN